jgi:hypothetical protein
MRELFGLSTMLAQHLVREAWRRHGVLAMNVTMALVSMVLAVLVLVSAALYVLNNSSLGAAERGLIATGRIVPSQH